MPDMSQNLVNHIESILTHLQAYLPLANVHMVDYFSKNVYKKYIPANIRAEIEDYGFKNTLTAIFDVNNGVSNNNLINLSEYLTKCELLGLKHCDKDICLDLSMLEDCLKVHGSKQLSSLKLSIFMTSKKSHEVEILSAIANAIKTITNTSHLVDIGDGKGYLSSMLAMHHKIPTLGVDSSIVNTNSSVERARKLSKIWNSVINNEQKGTKNTTVHLYKQITKFIDENIDLQTLVSDIFLEKPSNLGLVGLHTCGNLAPTSLRIFIKQDCVKSICNVGCCYHFLTEAYENSKDQSNSNNANLKGTTINSGYPMSNYLKQKKCVLGRAARMIAAQSIDRITAKRELPNISIFYRALFEVILEKKCGNLSVESRQVGRFRRNPINFVDYVNKASQRLKLDSLLDMSELEIIEIYNEYVHRIDELNVFYLIRAMLAPVIESLILLDRLLFMYEQGYGETSYLVQMFDPVLSPRCYGIVSFKHPVE